MATGSRLDSSIHRFGERAVHVAVPDQGHVHTLVEALLPAVATGLLEDAIPGDGSVLLVFDGTATGERRVRRLLRDADVRARDPRWLAARPPSRLVVIPVHYGGPDGPDLEHVAALVGLTQDEVIRRHSDPEYAVRFLGFAPGFPYIGDLVADLVVSRLATPRTATPAGSVAIAECYTGIYPAELPGGWQVIGRTSVTLFDPAAHPPTHLLPGDRVRFEPL